jgi:hypothetical protein
MTAEQRRRRARIAAHASWANTSDRAARTHAGTAAFLDRFERQVDPDGVLPAEIRACHGLACADRLHAAAGRAVGRGQTPPRQPRCSTTVQSLIVS